MQAQSWLNNLSTGYRFRGGIPLNAALNTFNSGLNRTMRKYLSQHNQLIYINHIKGGFFSSEKKWQEKEVTTQQLFYKNSKYIIWNWGGSVLTHLEQIQRLWPELSLQTYLALLHN